VKVQRAVDFCRLWQGAIPYPQFVAEADKHRPLWEGVYRTSRIPEWALRRACEKARGIRLLAVAENWCGDASSTIPVLAKLGDQADCLEMRLIKRDEHPEVMDHYLTSGARSIPIVIALDEQFQELGHWGPRPCELQHWVMENKDCMPRGERFRQIRKWYARDKGETTLREVLELVERA
jgi:hypothetical protein